MKKLLLLFITVLGVGKALAMDNQVIAPTLVLPPSQDTPLSKRVETSPRSARTSLDDSDWSDWSDSSRECSPRKVVIPTIKTTEQCGEYLDELDMRTLEIYLTLLQSKKLEKPVSYAFGLGLYQSGLTDEKSAPHVGTIQYFLTDAFKDAIKDYFKV